MSFGENGTFNTSILESNVTLSPINEPSAFEDPPPQLRLVFEIVVIGCMLLIMFAMGCEVTIPELVKHMKHPTGIVIGLVSQFLLLPLLGFIAVKILNITGLYAASILILSCSPGGGYSNLLTYLSRGDVPLSVAMTTISNVLALGMTPLNMWVYSRGLVTHSISIPFLKMFISLISLATILAFGMLLRHKLPKAAPYVVKAGVGSSGLLAVLCGVMAIFLYPDFFRAIPGNLYFAVLFVAPLGITFAYCIAWVFKESPPIRRTIAIEAAVQNIGTAITISIISFKREDLKVLSQYVMLYAGTTVLGILLAAGILALWRILCKSPDNDANSKTSSEKPLHSSALVESTTF